MSDLSSVIIQPDIIQSQFSSPTEIKTTLVSPSELNSVVENKVLTLVIFPPAEIRTTFQIAQGPAGPPGSGDPVKYTSRTDFVGSDVIYKGEALPGSSETDPAWRINKITFVGEDMINLWADGSADFNKMWSQRASYTYQ